MYSTTDFRRGLKIEIDGKPYEIIESEHFKPGKGGAMVRTKMRNMLTGRVEDKTFRSGEKVGRADMATQEMQYLYRDGQDYVFMDLESFEQVHVSSSTVGENGGYVKEGDKVQVLLYNGAFMELQVPASVILKVVETEPGLQGDRVSGATKSAKLETGISVNVPLFVNTGDTIKVDTRSGEYISRA
ncbi:elongation factor P [Desulfovibrio aminophilus]|uniref:elongation factor P n=1 Tax=Desulfovibrio aminophilus TaxID=81425 RepID=UPI003390DCA7